MDHKVLLIDYERSSVDFVKSNNLSLKNKFVNYNIIKSSKDIKLDYEYYLSKDHAVSYDLLKKVKDRYGNIGLIVFDQHMDLWNYNIVGNNLNKSNLIRKILDEKLINIVILVGVRKLELASFKKIFFLDKFNKKFTKELRDKNGFYNIKDKIKIIKINNFHRGFNKAVKFLIKKNIKNICLDIDLDVFNSDKIRGVEYTKENLNNCIDNDTKKYIKNELNVEGISPIINFKKIKEKDINLIYKHITEYNPFFDDGKTLDLIKEIINEL